MVIGGFGKLVETYESHLVEGPWMLSQKGTHRAYSNGGGQLQGEVVDPGADGGKGYRPTTVLQGQLQAGAIAGGQELPLPTVSAMPDRAGGQ